VDDIVRMCSQRSGSARTLVEKEIGVGASLWKETRSNSPEKVWSFGMLVMPVVVLST
jgi:hypothetical protein